MPALPAVPNVLKASIKWTISTDVEASTGLFFEYSGSAPNNSSCAAIATTVGAAFAEWAEYFDHDTTLTACEVTDLASASGGQGISSIGTTGTLTNPLSGASSVLVNYALSRRYRGGRPRSYLPWGDATKVSTRQTWASSFQANVQDALVTAFASIIGSSAGGTTITQHVNVSYYSGFTVITSPTTGRARNVPTLRSSPHVDTITSFLVSTHIANQRRRG